MTAERVSKAMDELRAAIEERCAEVGAPAGMFAQVFNALETMVPKEKVATPVDVDTDGVPLE